MEPVSTWAYTAPTGGHTAPMEVYETGDSGNEPKVLYLSGWVYADFGTWVLLWYGQDGEDIQMAIYSTGFDVHALKTSIVKGYVP